MHASPSGDLQAAIIEALRQAVGSLGHDASGLDLALKPIPLEGAWGFGSTVAFQMRKIGATGNPQELAPRIREALPPLAAVERVEESRRATRDAEAEVARLEDLLAEAQRRLRAAVRDAELAEDAASRAEDAAAKAAGSLRDADQRLGELRGA